MSLQFAKQLDPGTGKEPVWRRGIGKLSLCRYNMVQGMNTLANVNDHKVTIKGVDSGLNGSTKPVNHEMSRIFGGYSKSRRKRYESVLRLGGSETIDGQMRHSTEPMIPARDNDEASFHLRDFQLVWRFWVRLARGLDKSGLGQFVRIAQKNVQEE